jgi:uncharacterized low-complexity protein
MKKRTNSTKRIVEAAKGSVILSALAGLTMGQAPAKTYAYSPLGTGAEVRSALESMNSSQKAPAELKCAGESKKSDNKSSEGKCGEGKSGEEKADAKKDARKDAKKADSKTSEQKCGEGKCGN